MPNYRVILTSTLSTVISVDADNPDEAVEQAFDSDQMPTGICAQCSGWGQRFSVDDSGEWQEESVETEDGEVVWERDPILTPQQRVEQAEAELARAKAALAAQQAKTD